MRHADPGGIDADIPVTDQRSLLHLDRLRDDPFSSNLDGDAACPMQRENVFQTIDGSGVL